MWKEENANRLQQAYEAMMRTNGHGLRGIINDYKYIWANRTFFGERRSWIQRLFKM